MSKKKLYYLSHPYAPYGNRTKEMNLQAAKSYLMALNKEDIFTIAPWIGLIDSLENDEGLRESLPAEEEVLKRCDGLILCGYKMSAGMRIDTQIAVDNSLEVWDAMEMAPYIAARSVKAELDGGKNE